MPALTVADVWRRIARALAALPPLVVLGLAWLWLVIYAFPGLMTQDSFDHLREARDGIYSDGHPPAINLLWKIVEYVIAGPFGMLVIQSVALLAGLYLVLVRTFAPRRAAWLSAALFVFPPIMLPMAVIWKDCLMAGCLMLGLGALLSPRRGVRVAGLLAMSAATAFRYNALAATLPPIVLLFEWRPGAHWLRRYALATAAWLAMTLAAFGLNRALTDRPMYIWHSSLAVYDIVGTHAFLDEDVPDDQLRALLDGSELLTPRDIHGTMRALYSPRDFLPIINDQTRAMWRLPINGYEPAPAPQREAIARAWWDTLSGHPLAYVEHRLSVMAEVLSLGRSSPASVITRREVKYPDYAHQLGLGTGWSKLQHKLTRWMVRLWKATPIFVPWIYAALSLLLLPLALRHRDLLAILLSGLAMEGTLLVLAPSPDYRYSHWMVISTALAVVILTARRYRARKATT